MRKGNKGNHRIQDIIPAGNYPNEIEEKLGFDKIRDQIVQLCYTPAGKREASGIGFLTDPVQIHRLIGLCHEIALLRGEGIYFSFPEDTDEAELLNARTSAEGSILYEEELFLLLQTMRHFEQNLNNLVAHAETCPLLTELSESAESCGEAIQITEGILDNEGNMRPDASAELAKISRQIAEKEKSVRRILHSRFETARKNGWAGDTEITIRNERLVIPVLSEHKKKIPGVVHDDSPSGKFLYIEPLECFEENNLLRELQIARKKEKERILRNVVRELSVHRNNIQFNIRFCAKLDLHHARSVFSEKIRGIEPERAVKHDNCRLQQAMHPLLFLQMQKDNRSPVPLNFHFKTDNYLVVISGPNAGGKSIALKTIGLLQYMYQCGFPVPASEGTRMSVYRQIFIDIGDNQSLEQNLSSYSSHLLNMRYFLEYADRDTLYLIDEMGSGTDPAIGSTIAQAILEQLLHKKASGIVTTHFGNIKNWASNTPGVQNARMMYDLKKLEPLFILEPDKAGSSFAIEVATKAGLDAGILQRARAISRDRREIDLDELLAINEKLKKELSESVSRTESREQVLKKLIDEYEALKQTLDQHKKEILHQAKSQAAELIRNANAQIERTIKEIREKNAEAAHTRKLRKSLQNFIPPEEPVVDKIPKALKPSGHQVTSLLKKTGQLKPGDTVRHPSYPVTGEILQIKKEKAEVIFGHVKLWVPLGELILTSPERKKEARTASFQPELYNKQVNFRAELDLRGIRGEDAIAKLDEWLHDARLLGMYSLRIIHGRGYGILRKMIQEHLRSLSFVEHFEHESEQLGGDGVTLVRIS